MPGTVTGTIGGHAGVFFEYNGTGAALHLDVGFIPSRAEFEAATSNLGWWWNQNTAVAWVATPSAWTFGAAGVGQAIGTVTSVASIQGIQIGTDTTINSGVTYRGMCWR